MPGLVGFISKLPREQVEPRLKQMVASLCHESAYKFGMFIEESLGVYVGWVSRGNSRLDPMPVVNETGDLSLIFSGEEFPQPDTNRRLTENGHQVQEGPSAYLVHVAEETPSFPASLNGRFHGLLIDTVARRATLFNDRFGLHRLYYHESRDAFYFSAEAKAILSVCPELRSANSRGLGEFVTCGCVLENRTLFEGIGVLPTASRWIFENGPVPRKEIYFDPQEWENQPLLEPEAYYQQLREVFSQNLPRYFGGRDSIGLSLTGGLDTRMIVAWWKAAPNSIPTYSFGGMYRDCQDVVMAQRISAMCHQSHEVIRVGQEFLSQFASYAERTVYLTDACANVVSSSDLYVNERAARISPIRMTGNYGGEILRQVRAFKPVRPAANLFQPEFTPYVDAAVQTYSEIVQTHPLTFAAFRQAPWHHYGLLSLEQTQLSLRSPYLDNDFVRTVYRAPLSTLANNDISLRLIADGDPSLRKVRTDRGFAGNDGHILGSALREYLGFTFKAEYAYDYGMPQWVARIDHTFSALHLERIFLGRHKFYHFRVWYRDALSKYVQEMLLDPRTLSRPYINRGKLESIVKHHVKGDRNYTTEIHKVLTLELLHRTLLEAKFPGPVLQSCN
jgi:asparagine synthase (glutamine-hydrolysing)